MCEPQSVCIKSIWTKKHPRINSGFLFEAGARVAHLELFLSPWVLHTLYSEHGSLLECEEEAEVLQ